MKNQFNTDTEILEALRSGEPTRYSAALRYLFESDQLKNAIRAQVIAMGGSAQDVPAVLNEALLIFYNQVIDNQYVPSISRISTYVVSIAKNLFFTKKRSENRRTMRHNRSVESGTIETVTDPEKEMDFQHMQAVLDKVLMTTGDKCHAVLKMKFSGYSMIEIAERMIYKTQDVAKSAVLECRKKMNTYLAAHPELLAELKLL